MKLSMKEVLYDLYFCSSLYLIGRHSKNNHTGLALYTGHRYFFYRTLIQINMELFNVKDLNVLITGSSGGLGFFFAEGLAANGARVIINGRSQDRLEEAKNSLKREGYEVYPYVFDVSNQKEVASSMEKIQQEQGPIDVLINNAGVNIRAPLEEYPVND